MSPDHGDTGRRTSVARKRRGSSPLAIATAFQDEEECARFLARGTRELLESFTSGDPLRIAERCSRYLWDEGLLLDADRVTHRAMARIAFEASRRPQRPSLDGWLRSCIARAAADVLLESAERARSQDDGLQPGTALRTFICEGLGVDEGRAVSVCAAFNRQRRRERQAFFALIMERRRVQEVLDAGFGPSAWLRETCRRALGVLLGLDPARARETYYNEDPDDELGVTADE